MNGPRRGDILPTKEEVTVEALRLFIREEMQRFLAKLERSMRRARAHRTWFIDPDQYRDDLEDALDYDPDDEQEE